MRGVVDFKSQGNRVQVGRFSQQQFPQDAPMDIAEGGQTVGLPPVNAAILPERPQLEGVWAVGFGPQGRCSPRLSIR